MLHDFNAGILNETAHRPWPMPRAPWIMTQTWHDLLFAHWRVEPAAVAPLLPPSIELDTFDGSAWIGVVPFRMTNVAPRGVAPLPWLSAFPEMNVRTYVRWRGERPGVFFMSLDAANPFAVWVARVLFHLPYFRADMRILTSDTRVEYESRRAGSSEAFFGATYEPVAAASPPAAGTLEYFLTERYCLYTTNGRGVPMRLEIHHPRWPLQPARASIRRNTMAAAAGVTLPSEAPLLHFARRQDVVAWPLVRLE